MMGNLNACSKRGMRSGLPSPGQAERKVSGMTEKTTRQREGAPELLAMKPLTLVPWHLLGAQPGHTYA